MNRLVMPLAVAGVAWTALDGAARGASTQDPPAVIITGGADASGHNYTWRIENRANQAIARLTFPHYHADLFTCPPGWQQTCTFLVNEGVPDRAGICTAHAPPEGLAPGTGMDLSMRIASAGAVRGQGVVTVLFADGTTMTVEGVELPQAPSHMERFLPLFAFGAILALILIRRMMRRYLTGRRPDAGGAASAG
jgi:hypothetical protein